MMCVVILMTMMTSLAFSNVAAAPSGESVPASRLFSLDKEVKFFGRTYQSSGVTYFNWTNSGFEFNFKGKSAYATILSNAPGGTNTAYLSVYVDGVFSKYVKLDSTSLTVTLAEGLADTEHTIRVVKRTNTRSSTAGLEKLWIGEGDEKRLPNESSSRKLEFVGDSITVGYGTLGYKGQSWSTETEDGTLTCGAIVSEYFSAENNTIAVSGRGIVRNTDNTTTDLAPAMYEFTDWNNRVKWNHKNYVPDVIVINYGTNDYSVDVSSTNFGAGCKAFIEQVRADNPTSKIIYAYGFMGNAYASTVSSVVTELNNEGDPNVYYLPLTPVDDTEKTINSHPTAAANTDRAKAMIDKIAEITGWTQESGHNYQDSVAKASTCQTTGIGKKTCSLCGKTLQTVLPIDPAAHVYTHAFTYNDTHHWSECDLCHQRSADMPHEFDNACDAECNVCGATRTPSPHQYDNACDSECNICGTGRLVTHSFQTTWSKDKNKHWYECSICHAKKDNLAHIWNGGKILKPATTTTTGLKEYTCMVCKQTKTEVIPKIVIGKDAARDFIDINKTDWFYNAVNYAYLSDLFGGVSAKYFAPNAKMTRAMFVTVLGRLYGAKVNHNVVTKFTDVKKGEWYTGYVAWAVKSGIVSGISATSFAPNANVTREQICKMMIEYCYFAGVQLKRVKTPITFADAVLISDWAKTYVRQCQTAGLISGTTKGGKIFFNPKGNATRSEVAQILYNFSKTYLK